MITAAVKSLRPHQWFKNSFVLAPLVFAHKMGDLAADLRVAVAVVSFCLLSSAVYLLNDLMDVEKDRVHPVKRNRPIASGALPEPTARVMAAVIAALGLAAALVLGLPFLGTAVAYLVLNVAYSTALKKIAFVDVACIALGHLLRVLAGAVAIPVPPSRWLLVCTVLLSALLGFGKRAHELRVSGETGVAQRDVLGQYSSSVLRWLLVLLAIFTTATYLAYTQSQHAFGIFGTRRMLWTAPFVAFGVFRFVWITNRKKDAESPTDSMLRDVPFVLNLILYAAVIVTLIYIAP